MNWNSWIRQIHRWMSIIFTVTVIANFVALAQGGGMPPPWITYSPLLPLAFLLLTRSVHVRAAVCRQVAQREENMKKSGASQGQSASELISKRIADLGDWRGATLGRMRKLIKEADPDVVEEWKWMTPIWSHDGIICTGESYKKSVKLTFAKGAFLKDPARLFNSSLEGNVRRAIDIHEGEDGDASAFKALVRQAVAVNRAGKSKTKKKAEVLTRWPAHQA